MFGFKGSAKTALTACLLLASISNAQAKTYLFKIDGFFTNSGSSKISATGFFDANEVSPGVLKATGATGAITTDLFGSSNITGVNNLFNNIIGYPSNLISFPNNSVNGGAPFVGANSFFNGASIIEFSTDSNIFNEISMSNYVTPSSNVYGYYGSGGSSLNFVGKATFGPAAPAPLAGGGLLSAFAVAAALVMTRLRKRKILEA